MADTHDGQLDLGSVRATFPRWRIGGARDQRYAFRGGIEALEGPRSLLRRYLRANTLQGRAEQLGLQEYLDDLSDQLLADVWRQASLPKPSGAAS